MLGASVPYSPLLVPKLGVVQHRGRGGRIQHQTGATFDRGGMDQNLAFVLLGI